MRIETKYTVKIPELKHLISKKGGGTSQGLYDVFYYTRLFKYIHKRQYADIRPALLKVTADWKLKELCERGYLYSPSEDVYCATDKVLPILKANGKPPIFPTEPKGKGDINELSNTAAFIKLSKEKHFYTLLYPNFGYLIPDALMVEKDDTKYRLTFIEVERPKPNWEEYLNNKHKLYLRLSKDILFYETWIGYCRELDFPIPKIDVFKFNYRIIKNGTI